MRVKRVGWAVSVALHLSDAVRGPLSIAGGAGRRMLYGGCAQPALIQPLLAG
jgi:hypothetical protein